jgi:hypothetical protein
MVTAVLTITLLTVLASLASWLLGQWLTKRARLSSIALAAGAGGTVLLIGSVAAVMLAASTQWQHLIPVQDRSPMIAPAPMQPRGGEITKAEREPDSLPQGEQYQADVSASPDVTAVPIAVAEPGISWEAEPSTKPPRRARFDEPKERMLTAAERHLERSEYAEAIGIARQYLQDRPGDAEMRSMLARSLFAAEHPGSAAIIPAAVVAEWPATDCVLATRSDESSRWMLDNGCGRVVAVLFASCQLSETACFTNAVVSQGGWNYEPTGILMTAANDRPVPLRLGKEGPLVAPIFTIRDSETKPRQIRYLACEITAPGVLQLLRTLGGDEQRLKDELRADACYGQVLDWTRSGQRHGISPDSLLRRGID